MSDPRTPPDSPKHPKLDTYLNRLVAVGRAPERGYVKDGFVPDKSVGVSIYLSGNAETVAAWLESQGISRRDAASDDESRRAAWARRIIALPPAAMLTALPPICRWICWPPYPGNPG